MPGYLLGYVIYICIHAYIYIYIYTYTYIYIYICACDFSLLSFWKQARPDRRPALTIGSSIAHIIPLFFFLFFLMHLLPLSLVRSCDIGNHSANTKSTIYHCVYTSVCRDKKICLYLSPIRYIACCRPEPTSLQGVPQWVCIAQGACRDMSK